MQKTFRQKMAKAIFLPNTKRSGHSDSVNKEMLHNVAQTLINPLFVAKSKTVSSDFVAIFPILSLKGTKTPITVSIRPNVERKHTEINLVTSFYEKDTWKQYQNLIKDGLLYVDDQNNTEVAQIVRLQLP